MIIRLSRGLLGGVAMQRMHRARVFFRVILRRGFLPGSALHPWRWACRRAIVRIGFGRRLVLIVHAGARWDLRIGAAHADERIGLTDQPREFGQGIAVALCRRMRVTAIVIIVRGKGSVLISISHRNDASPSGKPPTRPTKRTDCYQMPSQVPCEGCAPYRISSGAWTPRTAKPDARTETTPWTKASRAFVISASLLIMKRK